MIFRPFSIAFVGAATLYIAAPATSWADDLFSANGVDVRWDNTFRYSNAIRVSPQSGTLLANANGDDGDRNLSSGVVSNRFDLESKFDLSMGNFGFHASATGWYDTVYHNHTDNRSQATYNVSTVPSTSFAPAVRDLEGQYAELNDAFVYGTFNIANAAISARLGRQTVLWGESLFYDANSIASAQAPTDYTRIVTGQSGYGNNVYLPVTQLSLTAQLRPDLSVTVYDHFGARPARQPGAGTYFNYVDYLGRGADLFFLPSGHVLQRQTDGRVKQSGQYGIAAHLSLDDADLGFYLLQYNATDPQIIMTGSASAVDPALAGFYKFVYPRDTVLIGASASGSLGESTISGEISLRRNAPFLAYPRGPVTLDPDGSPYIDYLKGDLVHLQASAELPMGMSAAWNSADLNVEVAADEVSSLNRSADGTTLERFAMKARFLFEPHYFQVLPNFDLSVPIGLGYNITGHSFNYYAQNGGTGDFEIGISALYQSIWKGSLKLTGFFGSPNRQPLADRNFISLSLERTF
jgi:hypothetical protein